MSTGKLVPYHRVSLQSKTFNSQTAKNNGLLKLKIDFLNRSNYM